MSKLTSYRARGFKRGDYDVRVHMIVDAENYDEAREIVKAVGGPDYFFNSTENIDHPVTDTAKNRLLSEQELYALVPEMNPKRRRHAAR